MVANLRIAALVGVSFLGISSPAFAQTADPAAAEEDSDGTIIVEARRRDESVQDVPLVVNAVTAEDIQRLNIRDFRDIQTIVPGLSMTSNSNGIGTTSSIRGINFDVNASGNFGTIEYYLNDVPISSGSLFQAIYDLGQIEVLRGPQGTLRGRASPSGSITISTRRPDLEEFGGYVQSTVNTNNGINLNGAVGFPVVEGILGVRIAGLIERTDGNLVESVQSIRSPGTRTESGRISVLFEPSSFLRAEGMYQRVDSRGRSFDQAACFNQFSAAALPCPVLITPGDRVGFTRAPNEYEQRFETFNWRVRAAFAGQQLIYSGGHLSQRLSAFAPQDPAVTIPVIFGQITNNEAEIDTHEIRLQNADRVAGLFDYVLGYFSNVQDTPSYIVGQTATNLAGNPLSPSFTVRGNNVTEASYFANLTVHLGERTEISGGLRSIEIDTDSRLFSSAVPLQAGCFVASGRTFCAPGALPFGLANITPLVLSGTQTELVFAPQNPRNFQRTIYSGSIKHEFTDNFMVYANFGTSFRPGNNVVRFPPNRALSAVESQFIATPAETSEAYEIGFKSDFADNTLRLNVSAFRQDFVNYPYRSQSGVFFLQYDAPTPVPVGTNGRVASGNFVSPVPVRVEGFEVELAWMPSDRFSLTANLAYAVGRIRNGVVACNDFVTPDGQPDVVTAAPSAAALFARVGTNNVSACTVNFRAGSASPWNGTIQAEHNADLNASTQIYARGLATFANGSQSDAANPFDNRGSYALINLYAGLRDADGAWEVSVYGKNLTGNDSILATSLGPLFTTAGASTINSPYIGIGNASTPGLVNPREFGITARFAFGSR
jgi:iron complex outermembrane recepter protein